MLGPLFAIVSNAFAETVRQPLYLVVLLGGFLLLGLNPALTAFTIYEDDKLLLDLALSTVFLCAFVLAIFTSTQSFAQEVEDKTILNMLSKPVGRAVLLLGKFIGLNLAIQVAVYLWALGFLLTLRHGVLFAAGMSLDWPVILLGCGAVLLALVLGAAGNYLYRWSFNTTVLIVLLPSMTLGYLLVLSFDKEWSAQALSTDWDREKLAGLFLLAQAVLLISSLAFAASIRLRQIVTLLLCLAVLVLGLSSDFLFGEAAQYSLLLRGVYALLPNFQVLWMADALTQEHPIPTSYLVKATFYCASYVLALLGLSMALFETREVG